VQSGTQYLLIKAYRNNVTLRHNEWID